MANALDDKRPDPNELLAQVAAEEALRTRGRLKIFFGAASGVGKTYAMLAAGRTKSAEGVDVVVGYAEPHARPETEAMLLGLELLPYRFVDYRNTRLKEFDLDAAIKRRPELLLVDELAHTNAPGSRHEKRWQDVDEALRAGIDVYTTLNVQHIESLNDVIAQITGVTVRETLPDTVLEQADEVELVDLSPEDLLERLREGKVYIPQQAQQAMQGFFRKANLSALRELSLRKTAERVNEQVRMERLGQSPRQTWPTAERVLVCVSPNKANAKVIRSAKRLAVSLHAEWIAAFVETPSLRRMDAGEREQLLKNTGLAERLGAEAVTLSGLNVVDELVNYARSRNVTKIVAGKPDRPWWVDLIYHSHVDQLLRKSGEIDVYVVRGIGAEEQENAAKVASQRENPSSEWRLDSYGWSAAAVACCTAVAAVMHMLWNAFDLSNLIMIYLVGVVVAAARYGRGPSAFAAVLSVLVFDFFFVPPRFSFAVGDTQYLITFLVMLGVALLIGTLTVRIREQADASRQRERRTEALYRMTQQLALTRGLAGITEAAVRQMGDVFHGHVTLLTPDRESKQLAVRASLDTRHQLPESERAVAQWVFEHQQQAGAGTETLPSAAALYLPLIASGRAIGVVGLTTEDVGSLLTPGPRTLLDAFVDQIALAIERDELAEQARRAQVQAEAEAMRSSLLSSVSHDLRTPLAIITAASSSLAESPSADRARETAHTIHGEAARLNHLVNNLLDITRLESGAVQIAKQWQPIEEVIGSALTHLESQLAGRKIATQLAGDLPLVPIDGVLIEQVIVNLLENAVKYTPAGSPIEIEAKLRKQNGDLPCVVVSVTDHGPGLALGEESWIFDKFVRGSNAASHRGVGLGLAICRAAVKAHGGQIWAENRPQSIGGGAVFHFSIPIVGTPPEVNPT